MRDKHHVLVVNRAPRSTLEHTLERAGYHVSWAAHTLPAVQRLANERIDVVILDTEGCDGVSDIVAWALRQHWPHAAVLMLAEAGADAAAQIAADSGWRLLRKPLATRRLKQCLEKVLPTPMPASSLWYECQHSSGSLPATPAS